MSVNMSGSGTVGLGVGVGSYQSGVYVPLKALFLVYLVKLAMQETGYTYFLLQSIDCGFSLEPPCHVYPQSML